MKTIFTSALLLVGISMFAQKTTANKPTTSTTTTPTAATTSDPKMKALSKTWLLMQTENFGDVHQPTAQQKNDLLFLDESGNYRFVYNGAVESGSWTLDKTGVWITLTSAGGVTKRLKVMESTATTLKVDYEDGDDVHNVLYYSTTAVASGK